MGREIVLMDLTRFNLFMNKIIGRTVTLENFTCEVRSSCQKCNNKSHKYDSDLCGGE